MKTLWSSVIASRIAGHALCVVVFASYLSGDVACDGVPDFLAGAFEVFGDEVFVFVEVVFEGAAVLSHQLVRQSFDLLCLYSPHTPPHRNALYKLFGTNQYLRMVFCFLL